MSSTNKTTNYELSQFIGTDKPAWLTDYNADMGKIDAGVYTAQSAATAADGKATANTTAIGTLSNLNTEAKTNLVGAVNEVNTNAGTALNTASNAAGTATNALNKANALVNYLTLSSITQIDSNKVIAQSGTVSSPNITLAKNSTASMGKLYGRFDHTPTGSGTQTITLNIDSGIHPDADFTIFPAGNAIVTSASYSQSPVSVSVTYKTDGKITISFWGDYAVKYVIYLWPCLYFFTNFGDVPSES